MVKLEEAVRSVEMPGLVWGASKLVPIGYGIKKLQITLVVGTLHLRSFLLIHSHCASTSTEDELVSLEDLQDKVAEFEDYVQSTDVAAMQSTFSSLGPCSYRDAYRSILEL